MCRGRCEEIWTMCMCVVVVSTYLCSCSDFFLCFTCRLYYIFQPHVSILFSRNRDRKLLDIQSKFFIDVREKKSGEIPRF